jgi:hypothetical protein
VFHSPNHPGWPRGLEGAKQLAKAVVEHPDYIDRQSKIEDIPAVDDKVILRWRVFGTEVGEEKPGSPKKSERFASAAIAIYRFIDGKIVDDRVFKSSAPGRLRGDESAEHRRWRASMSSDGESWDLRDAVSLAHLATRIAATTMLAETYNWFTEGFDTADLKGAKALLDE